MHVLASTLHIAVGDVLDGKYEITKVLGEGAMGVVYQALHKRLQRTVALKTLRSEYAGNAELIDRFEREARAASAIGHPNIVQVFDAGGDLGGTPYLVMEFLEGQSLGDLLHDEAPLSIERSIDICAQVLAGLGAAHSVGILHRDLKPDNIFITTNGEGQELAKILDFGISKVLDIADPSIVGGARATRAGMVLGTPLYMSPEQASGRADLDLRTDLWSAVCVLYECLTGKTPFNGENYNQILAAVMQGIFMGVREHRPNVPNELHELVQRGLKVERDDRFPDATSLSVALTSINLALTETAKTEIDAEPQMLAAFDNLADRFLEQEREERAVSTAPTPSAARPAAALAKSKAPPALDPFAPPESQVEVRLDLETDPLAPGPRDYVERNVSAPRPTRRAHSQMVTRRESGGLAAFLGKSLLILLIAAAAGAGYRYHKLGYILPQHAPPAARLVIELDPENTSFLLNEVPTPERSVNLIGGKTYAMALRAANRLDMRSSVQIQPGDKIRVSQVMWHQILAIDAKVVSEAPAPPAEATSSEHQTTTRAKMDAYGDCGTRLSKALREAVAAEELAPLSRTLSDECIATFDLAIAQAPSLEELDGASTRFRSALSDYALAMEELKRSKGGSAKIERQRSAEARAAARAMEKSASTWLTSMSQVQSNWHQSELLRAKLSGEDPLHAEVRALAVASDTWMRTHLAGKPAYAARASMAEHYAILIKSAGQRSDELKDRGVTAYLNALRPLMDEEPGEEALFWHNQSVEMFNRIQIPLMIAVDSANQ